MSYSIQGPSLRITFVENSLLVSFSGGGNWIPDEEFGFYRNGLFQSEFFN